MVNINMATPAGPPVVNNHNNLCEKLGQMRSTYAHKRQYVTRESSNFKLRIRDVVGETIAIFTVGLGIWASAWAACAMSDACYAAQGGLF